MTYLAVWRVLYQKLGCACSIAGTVQGRHLFINTINTLNFNFKMKSPELKSKETNKELAKYTFQRSSELSFKLLRVEDVG